MDTLARCCFFLGALVGALPPRSTASAGTQATLRLNGPLATTAAADVAPDYRFDPSSGEVVFRADLEADGRFELFAAPADGSAPARRLNTPLAPGSAVAAFALAAGGIVVYLADQDVAGQSELYGVSLAGGAPRLLSGALVAGGEVESFLLTPDGAQAVFVADALVAGRCEHFRVPVDGSAPRLALDRSPGTNPIRRTIVHPDGARILFTRWLPALLQERLVSLALDGSGAKLVLAYSGAPVYGEGTEFVEVQVTPDGASAVASTVEVLDSDPFESRIFSVPLDASRAPMDLHVHAENWERPFRLSSSTERVVFQDLENLVSVNTDGSGRVELEPAGWRALSVFDVTPDGDTVVFEAWLSGGTTRLFVAPVDGHEPALQIPARPAGTRILTDTTLYLCEFDASSFLGLYAQPLSGGPRLLLNGPAAPGSGAINSVPLARTADEEILFVARPAGEAGRGIYIVPGDGSAAPAHVGPVLGALQSLPSFQLSPDGEHVAYVADRSSPGTFELFPAAITTRPPDRPYLALPPGPVEGDVRDFRVAPNGRGLVYRADQRAVGYDQLFRSTLDGAPLPLTSVLFVGAQFEYTRTGSHVLFQHPFGELFSALNAPGSTQVHLDYTHFPTAITSTPDGQRVVYERLIAGSRELVSVRVADGSWVMLFDGDVDHFQLSPDGSQVVYQVGPQLAAIAVTGGAAIALTPPGGAPVAANSMRISPDSSWVYFRRSQRLWRVPIDGSAAVAAVSPPSPAGSVVDFQFAPAGTRAVYRASPDGSAKRELSGFDWSGAPAVFPLTAHGAVVQQDYRVTADGLRVVYRVDGATPGVHELHAVRLDGAAPPVRLSAPLASGGEVHSFALAPDGRRAVYLAAEDAGDVRELFGVSVRAGAAVPLDPLPAFADVETYRIDPGSQQVFALCDREADGMRELFALPLDGSGVAQRVNDPLPPGGEVFADFVPLSKGGVVFRAEQEADDVVELFLGVSLPRRRP
jgi:hypothetical protein